MNQQDHELISRYLDQELDASERTALEARLGAEPELRETLDRFRGVDQELCRAMAKEGHVPVDTAALLSKRGDTVAVLPRRKPQRWGLAMAASLLAGVAVINGPQWVADSQDNLLVPNIEESVAFSEILDSNPSQARGWLPVEDDVQMRPVLSFASTGGTWCREFVLHRTTRPGGVLPAAGKAAGTSSYWFRLRVSPVRAVATRPPALKRPTW